MEKRLLDKRDTDYVRDNLIFNYISQYHFMPLVNIQEYT